MATRLDPEDLRDVIGAYHRAVAEVIGRFDGFVAKYMGDGVLTYFGYPRAHEDDAERAVRAGLALVAAVPRLELVAEVGLQAGGENGGFADHTALLRLARSGQIANDDKTGGDADADL